MFGNFGWADGEQQHESPQTTQDRNNPQLFLDPDNAIDPLFGYHRAQRDDILDHSFTSMSQPSSHDHHREVSQPCNHCFKYIHQSVLAGPWWAIHSVSYPALCPSSTVLCRLARRSTPASSSPAGCTYTGRLWFKSPAGDRAPNVRFVVVR
jgi:hypothetical protein